MGLGYNKYDIQVRDQKSLGAGANDGAVTSDVLVFVYDAGTKTLSTIYSDAVGTAKSNPISRSQFSTDKGIKFYSASASHDIYVNTASGETARSASVTPYQHTISVDKDGVDKCLVFPMVFNAGGTETDTGLDLPKLCKVYDAAIEVVTTDATETVAIGLLSSETSGDADGIMIATSVANAGYFQLWSQAVGSNETYVDAVRAGALMGVGKIGTDAANDCGLPAGPGHIVSGSNAVSISYSPSSSDTFAGYGYVYFRHLR